MASIIDDEKLIGLKFKKEKEGIVYIEPPSMDELNKRREELLETMRECREITKTAKKLYRHFRLSLENKGGD